MKKVICMILAMLMLLTACGAPAAENSTTAAAANGKLCAQIGGEEVAFEPLE